MVVSRQDFHQSAPAVGLQIVNAFYKRGAGASSHPRLRAAGSLLLFSFSFLFPSRTPLPGAPVDAPPRVLLIHSFGRAAPPFTTASTAFETALSEEMGKRVDLDEVSLDVARYATLDMEEAIIELMRKRQTKWQPDLVVPFGSPAGIFVAEHRDRLFSPATTIIYTGMDQRRLPAGALNHNATFVGASYDLSGSVNDILALSPGTTNLVVVIGASPLEQFWAEVLRREYAVFTNRLGITWFDDLSFEEMLERSARLPPHSFMLFILLVRDAAGVAHDANDALRRLHRVANAPIAGLFNEQLGLGSIGGRIYSDAVEGREAAHIATRILRGEPATNFPPKVIAPPGYRYDWRELRCWKISEARLPAGSIVQFREPSLWQRFRGRIIGVVAIVVFQAAVISLLLTNLIRRRRAERSLTESEVRFQNAADTSPVMVWTTGPDKHCTFVNQSWLDFTGNTLEKELGYGWAEGIHPDDAAACLKIFEECFDARREFTLHYRLRDRNGDYAWMLDKGNPRYTSDGTFVGYVGSVTDITALKQAEERWRSVVEGAPNAMVVFDADGKIALVNARTEQMFGYARAELIGSAVEMLLPEATRVRHLRQLDDYMKHPVEVTMGVSREIFGRRKDGSTVPLEICLSPIRTPEGEFVLAFIIDLTERLAAEARLRESDKRMTLAAEAANLGMWVWDAPETYIWASAKWKAIHGYAPEADIRYDGLIDRVFPADRDAVDNAIAEGFNHRRAFHVQHRVLWPDKTVRWVATSGRVEQLPNDGPRRLLGVSIDITDRKEAEEAAREVSGKLITAQEDERRRIARDLHDDLNQRLALLSVETDLLGRMETEPQARALITDIASRVHELSSEVHNLSYQLHPAKLDQLGLVAATRSFCIELGKQCDVVVEFIHEHVPRNLSDEVALSLYRMVQESLQNMVKHSRASHARVELFRRKDEIVLTISDNGRGFDLAAVGSRAGLGLVGMRERARLVKGNIVFQSSPGEGTRIEATIPLVASEAMASRG